MCSEAGKSKQKIKHQSKEGLEIKSETEKRKDQEKKRV